MRQILSATILATLLWGCGTESDIIPPMQVDRLGRETCKEGTRPDSLVAGSWNLAVGFDVKDLFFLDPDSTAAIYRRAEKIFADARRNQPRERIRLMAREIAASRAEVVGLQEVLYLAKGDSLIANFLDTLRSDLALLGANYKFYLRPLNVQTMRMNPPTPAHDTLVMHFKEGQALLVSDRFDVLQEGVLAYRNVIPVTLPGGVHTVTERAVQWALLRAKDGFQVEVWNTHLEILQAQITAQTGEFLSLSDSLRAAKVAQFSPSGRVFLGDINNIPGDASPTMLLNAGWKDTWDESRLGLGYTYGGGSLRDSVKNFHQRIDRVMHQGGCSIDSAWITGNKATLTDSGWLFPSDHVLVLAKIRYGIRP
jgi:endonuclease/exonuclease/phosphatase family metal-dependent hydrolase